MVEHLSVGGEEATGNAAVCSGAPFVDKQVKGWMYFCFVEG